MYRQAEQDETYINGKLKLKQYFHIKMDFASVRIYDKNNDYSHLLQNRVQNSFEVENI